MGSPPLILRWDLDKTYLATEFESLRSLMKIPFETAAEKRNIPGARSLIRAIQAEAREDGRALQTYFITASPPQLRGPIEEKLTNDGIDWHGIVYKDQVRDLLRGRFRELRQHVGYKLGALLEQRREIGASDAQEWLFGDDWEQDALAYSLYADLMAGLVSEDEARAVLFATRVEPIGPLLRRAAELRRPSPPVRRILIHRARGISLAHLRAFGPRLVATDSYLQTAAVLHVDGLLSEAGIGLVAEDLKSHTGWSGDRVRAEMLDLGHRGITSEIDALRLADRVSSGGPMLLPSPVKAPATEVHPVQSASAGGRLRTWWKHKLDSFALRRAQRLGWSPPVPPSLPTTPHRVPARYATILIRILAEKPTSRPRRKRKRKR